jgi:hypothetical protein
MKDFLRGEARRVAANMRTASGDEFDTSVSAPARATGQPMDWGHTRQKAHKANGPALSHRAAAVLIVKR